MANIHLPNNTICNSIAHNIAYNANYDIVWSFDYSLSGNSSSQGSFTTFLFDGDSLSGGGPGIGGAYYTPGSFLSGGNSIFSTPVVSAILGINFDTTGLFALSGNSVSKGILSAIPNSLTVRYGQTNFEYLTSVALTSLYTDFKFLLSSKEYNRLRFRLTDVGQTLKVDYKIQDNFVEIFKIPVDIDITNNTAYKVGIGYTTPVSGNNAKQAIFTIKNFHIEGKTESPNSNIIQPNNTTFAVYPVCALPVVVPPSDPTITRTLPRIYDIACPIAGPGNVETPEICLANFQTLSSEDEIEISNLSLDCAYTLLAQPIIAESVNDPIYVPYGTFISDIVSFSNDNRNAFFPKRYIVNVGDKIGNSTFNYVITGQPVKIEFRYGSTSTTIVSSLSYASENSNQTFNLLSEFNLRGIDPAAESITSTTSGGVFITRSPSLSSPEIEIAVYGPVAGGSYKFKVGYPDNIQYMGSTTHLLQHVITGANFLSPLSGVYSYYPYNFTNYTWPRDTTFTFAYSAQNLPERIQVVDINSDKILLDTQWIGNSAKGFIDLINGYLNRVGENVIDTIYPGTSSTFFRTIGHGPVAVRVYAPLYNSRWAFRIA
jgi:hypothetical protein